MMKCALILLAISLSGAALAETETFEGVVKVLGSSLNSRTYLVTSDGQNLKLCRDRISEQLNHYINMTAKAQGEWQDKDSKRRRCAAIKTLEIVKTQTGRPPLIGTLKKQNDEYSVITETGTELKLEGIPEPMKQLVDKKILLDLSQSLNATKADSPYSVMTYAPFPAFSAESPNIINTSSENLNTTETNR